MLSHAGSQNQYRPLSAIALALVQSATVDATPICSSVALSVTGRLVRSVWSWLIEDVLLWNGGISYAKFPSMGVVNAAMCKPALHYGSLVDSEHTSLHSSQTVVQSRSESQVMVCVRVQWLIVRV